MNLSNLSRIAIVAAVAISALAGCERRDTPSTTGQAGGSSTVAGTMPNTTTDIPPNSASSATGLERATNAAAIASAASAAR